MATGLIGHIRRLSSSGDSLYKILDVKKSATQNEINKAYEQFSCAASSPVDELSDPVAHERFQDVCRAYSILSDESKRSIYDQTGSRGIFLGEHLGYKYMKSFADFKSWSRNAMIFLGINACIWSIPTCCFGFCFGCCCCYCNCCCNYCCGKYKPPILDDIEELKESFFSPNQSEDSTQTDNQDRDPIMKQPNCLSKVQWESPTDRDDERSPVGKLHKLMTTEL